MAMLVAHNSSSALALGELNKNNSRLSKDLQKVSSGMKINSAGDGAAEYAISEKMRVMVRSLGQDIENSQKGIDIVKVAEGGIQNIIEELRTMKEMAINSANDHNSEVDRKTLQKEFASRMEGINDIASTTNYNGKVLLDGTYWYKEYEEVIQIGDSGSVRGNVNGSSNGMRLAGGFFSGRSAAYPASRAFAGSMVRTSADLLGMSDDSNQISIQSSLLQSNNSNATESITFDPLTGLVPNSTAVGLFPSRPNWYYPYDMHACPRVERGYENYLDSSEGYAPIPYTKFNDVPGYQDFGIPCIVRPIALGGEGGGMTGQFYKYYMFAEQPVPPDIFREREVLRSIPEVGTEVWLQGGFCDDIRSGPSSSDIRVLGKFKIAEEPGTGIKVIYDESTNHHGDLTSYICEKIDFSNVQGNIPDDLNNQGFTIQCEACMEYITIRFDSERSVGEGIVSISSLPRTNIEYQPVEQYTVYSYVVGIKDVTSTAELETALFQGLADAKGYAVGGGVQLNPQHDVRIRYIDGNLYLTKEYGGTKYAPRMIIKEGVMGTLSGGNTTATGGTTSGADTQPGGDDTLPGGDDTTPGGDDTMPGGDDTMPGGDDTLPGGDDTLPGGDDTTPGGDDTLPGGGDTVPGVGDTIGGSGGYYGRRVWAEGNPLIIHTGPKANQHLRVYINDMHIEALGLKDVAVDPIEKALEALGKLDEALEYALNENVRMGSYQVRLQETVDNLTIQHENATASDSTIRDADMAKEMAAFVRDNILTQAAQSMLAQANQSSNSVLQLLQ
ncbi:flagellin [Selenomonas sp. KH1T6]|uniref:flagellin N-terminal helical domain-containing protein n=1 Tax=Selenomonas sp. KH1T6 TaxID=3158784 RepID=UPI0008A7E807|nr:flagellin C-terminal helical region [Selenomonas ruminantium]